MGELPWQGQKAKTKEEKYKKIKESKCNTPIDVLTQGYPKEFMDYMVYCQNLGFTDEPDYSYLRRIFKDLYVRCGFENEFIFDWTIQRYHAQMDQNQFGAQMGLRRGGSSDAGSPLGSDEEEKYSLENRFPISDDEVVQPGEIDKNTIKLEAMEDEDNEIIEKYRGHIEQQIKGQKLNQNQREMEGGHYSDQFNIPQE